MSKIKLANSGIAIVDQIDHSFLSQWVWRLGPCGYAQRYVSVNDRTHVILMHRAVTCCPTAVVIDHINGNKLDNRKGNLRFCNHSQNQANKRLSAKSSSGYKGVSRRPNGKWLAMIRKEGKAYCLGSFAIAKDASNAYQRAAKELFGEFTGRRK